MTKEEKQLLLADLCARLPYGVMCNRLGNIRKLLSVSPYNDYCFELYNGVYVTKRYKIDEIKPYLRPMTSMSKEEEREVQILWNEDFYDKNSWYHCYPKTAEFYHSHHLDYRGLIPMGLALEAPVGMYETPNIKE